MEDGEQKQIETRMAAAVSTQADRCAVVYDAIGVGLG